jgi:hypothetical protein
VAHLSAQHAPHRSAWSVALIVLLGALLSVSACANGLFDRGGAPVGTPPSLDIKAAHSLTWQKHTMPMAGGLTSDPGWGTWLAIAPGDGNTAYACGWAGQTGLWQLWATRDQAEHWTLGATIASDRTLNYDCLLVVDARQPARIIALVLPRAAYGANTPSGEVQSYVSVDGGATFAKLAAPANDTPLYTALATHSNTTYALARGTCTLCKQALYRSADGMKTWARADTGVFEENNGRATRSIFAFWTATSGDLLATVASGLSSELWRSTDGGDHWNAFAQTWGSVTGSGSISNMGIVAAGGQAAFWRACVSNSKVLSKTKDDTNEYSVKHTMEVTCTVDGGRTWLTTGSREANVDTQILAQAPDGAVLATTNSALVRIAPGQQQWDSLGSAPGIFTFTYALSADGKSGVFWSNLTSEGIYTATYP